MKKVKLGEHSKGGAFTLDVERLLPGAGDAAPLEAAQGRRGRVPEQAHRPGQGEVGINPEVR